MKRPHLRSTLLAVAVVIFTITAASVGTALAGQEPYVAVVGFDRNIPQFYISDKLYQFTHDFDVPLPGLPESFFASQPITQPEWCQIPGDSPIFTNRNARVREGNEGFFQWTVALPKKPQGNLNIVLQCGILKPQETDIWECAGETGERQGPGRCNRRFDQPGTNPVVAGALPRVEAWASAGVEQQCGSTPPRVSEPRDARC